MFAGIVAIVGRPNVGKSTLFNRLTISDLAIVDDKPGVTRDRLYGSAWVDRDKGEGFTVIDTGGFETSDYNFQPFADNIVWEQTKAAIKEADIVLFVLDAQSGLHPHDGEILRIIKKLDKPLYTIANKADGAKQMENLWDFAELGLEQDPEPVSAAHNRGINDLKETLYERLQGLESVARTKKYDDDATSIAIIGRPNAGKSSLLNRLTGSERAIVSDIAGTTRDPIDTLLSYHNQQYVLVDTAGIRRKTKINERLESLSVMRALRAMEQAHLVFLVIDALEGITDQDARLVNLALDRYKPVLIVVNKWDLLPDKHANSAKEYTEAIHNILKVQAFLPVVFISCLTNQRVHSLLDMAQRLKAQYQKRIPTSLLNNVVAEIAESHSPALIKGRTKMVKFYFSTQVRAEPPTFVIKTNAANDIQESYKRFFTNRLRSALGFDDIPIRLFFRDKHKKSTGTYSKQSFEHDIEHDSDLDDQELQG